MSVFELLFFLFSPSPPTQKLYLPSYTHPNKPPAGYSTDFAPVPTTIILSDGPEAGPSEVKEEPGSILVCAYCLDSLPLNGNKENRNRVFGLR